MAKERIGDWHYPHPTLGGHVPIPLRSTDRHEAFILDIQRGRVEMRRISYQTRARTAVVLARLDMAGPPHRNPDGEEVPCPHLHVYREGFGDKWAGALPMAGVGPGVDAWRTLQEFMRYCNVIKPPIIDRGILA